MRNTLRIMLLCLGSVSLTTVLPWAILAFNDTQQKTLLYVASLVVAIAFFAMSLLVITTSRTTTMSMVAGINMVVGTFAQLPVIAMIGAILALPFAIADWRRTK